ncbi:hypothetical protein VE04_10134, partial [Pseudogymnoascus sp. 24MN13]
MTPAHQAFCDGGDYTAITTHLQSLTNQRADEHRTMKFAPFITAFQSYGRKLQTIAAAPEEDKPFYEVCETVPNARKQLPAGLGGIAIITSPLQNAAQLATANEWHAAVVMRKGATMWIFDPAFDLNNPPKDSLLTRAKGLVIAQNIWTEIGRNGARIQNVYIQGVGENEEPTCLGRSIQFVERFLNGSITEPFKADD